MKKRRPQRGYRPAKRPSWKDSYVLWLHHQPCRWDVLGYELSQALAEQCRRVCPGLMEKVLRFDGNEQQLVGRLLAQGFEVLVTQNWPAESGEGWPSLWPVDEANVQAASARAARCFEGLLRKYVWDRYETYLPRPDRDLDKLVQDLTGALGEFLLKRCAAGKDLEGCLRDPLASDGGFFPKTDMPLVEGPATGDPARDVRQLTLQMREQDDAGELKGKLVRFVRTDPWLAEELIIRVLEKVADAEEEAEEEAEAAEDINMAGEEATDDFIFDATSLEGKSPIELFLARRPDMSVRQRQRLERWDREAFLGAFVVEAVEGNFLQLEDLSTGLRLRATMTRIALIHRIRPGSILATRLMPWDDYWLMSGVQRYFDSVGSKELQRTRKEALLRPLWRPAQMEGPARAKAWQAQAEYYDAWMQLFGTDEMLFESGKQLQEAMHRFYVFWNHEYIQKNHGMTAEEKHRRDHGQPPPAEPSPRLPQDLLDADDVAVLNDPRHGIEFLAGYGAFLRSFEGHGPLTPEQVAQVWEYLTDGSIPYRIFQNMRQRHPRRTEEVFRVVLRDQEFQLERDFDKILGTFKGSQLRHGPAPSVTVTNLERL